MGRYELRDLIRQRITVTGGAQAWADRRWDFAMSPRRPPSHRTHTERATHERIVREVLAARATERSFAIELERLREQVGVDLAGPTFEQQCWNAIAVACEIPRELLYAK